jgi:DNA-binding NarL/FixJ family response regulator
MSEIGKQENFITVAVVDDDAHVRTGLWWLLNNVVGMRCAGVFSTYREALTTLSSQPPDVILLDVSMPDISGIDAIRPLHAKLPVAKIIMHSNYDDEEKIVGSMKAGAAGYVLKNSSAPTLYDAIVKAHQGGSVWPPGFDAEPAASANSSRSIHFLKALMNKIGGMLRPLLKR